MVGEDPSGRRMFVIIRSRTTDTRTAVRSPSALTRLICRSENLSSPESKTNLSCAGSGRSAAADHSARYILGFLRRVKAVDGGAERRIDVVLRRLDDGEHEHERRGEMHQFCSVKLIVIVMSTETGTPFSSVGV